MSKLSIFGLYQYDHSLFDNLNLPVGFTTEDRETLINNLLMECAEFECTYPAFDFCKAAIGFWSKARLPVWEKLYASLHFEYNPIWNKDGTITETRTKEYSDEKTGEVESTKAGETSETATVGKQAVVEKNDSVTGSRIVGGSTSSTTENKTAGFNSSDYVNKDKQTVSGTYSENDTTTDRHVISENTNATDSTTGSGSTSETGTTSETGSSSGSETEEYSRVEQGNIGVTSTQQLIKEEREVALFEIDDFIINDFKKQFCILVY